MNYKKTLMLFLGVICVNSYADTLEMVNNNAIPLRFHVSSNKCYDYNIDDQTFTVQPGSSHTFYDHARDNCAFDNQDVWLQFTVEAEFTGGNWTNIGYTHFNLSSDPDYSGRFGACSNFDYATTDYYDHIGSYDEGHDYLQNWCINLHNSVFTPSEIPTTDFEPNQSAIGITATVTASHHGGDDSAKVTYTFTNHYFICKSDNVTSSGTPNYCGILLENDGSNLEWYADGGQLGSWKDWCSHTGPAADPKCSTDGAKLVAFNKLGHGGHHDWHLPTAPNAWNATSPNQVGGECGSLANYASNNGMGSNESLYQWLSTYGFVNLHYYSYPYYLTSHANQSMAYIIGIHSFLPPFNSVGEMTSSGYGSDAGILLVRQKSN